MRFSEPTYTRFYYLLSAMIARGMLRDICAGRQGMYGAKFVPRTGPEIYKERCISLAIATERTFLETMSRLND